MNLNKLCTKLFSSYIEIGKCRKIMKTYNERYRTIELPAIV